MLFITRSIESWFDVKVDAALEGGINLGQQVIEQMTVDLEAKANAMALDLADRPQPQLVAQLERLRGQLGIEEAVVVTASGRLLASAATGRHPAGARAAGGQALRQARAKRIYTAVDAAGGKRARAARRRAARHGARGVPRRASCSCGRAYRPQLARSAEAVEAAYRDYRELAISRDGLKRIYVVTLSFALLMALFVAVAVAATQSGLLAEPLANLAQATQAVARGDFSRQAPVTSRDELGVLTESFNSMTRQLDEARRGVESNRARARGCQGAPGEHPRQPVGRRAGVRPRAGTFDLQSWCRAPSSAPSSTHSPTRMRAQFAEHGEQQLAARAAAEGHRQDACTRAARACRKPPAAATWWCSTTSHSSIQAQRATAWAEVARRLAHEIKNPLTPIQLSAERLEMKLAERLPREDAETLRRATETIVNQVAALKAMVDDFRDYARLPAPEPGAARPERAGARSACALREFAACRSPSVCAEPLPPVWADGAQIRQVIHNLVQNAQDALESLAARGASPAIEVRTELAGDRVRLAVSDNGGGFPEELMARIFEPYVTTKPRGTGLGLAIVKKIVDEHHGAVTIENRPS